MAEQKPHWTEALITVWELKGIWIFYHSICYFSKSWNTFDQHLNKSPLPQALWMDLLPPLSSRPSQSCFPQANWAKRLLPGNLQNGNGRNSTWEFPVTVSRYIPPTHKWGKIKLPRERNQQLPRTLWEGSSLSRTEFSSALHSHQNSQENALHKRSWEPSWWEVRPFKSNREHNLHQDRGGEARAAQGTTFRPVLTFS